MFATLIESEGSRNTHSRWLPASAVIHLLLLAGALSYSSPAHGSKAPPTMTPELIWVAPQSEATTTRRSGTGGSAAAAPARAEWPLPTPGEGVVVDVRDVTSSGIRDIEGAMTPTTRLGGPTSSGISLGDGGPVWASQVEKVALPLPGNPIPAYPGVLRSAGIEGSVTLRFVIDTSGAVERGSAVVVRSDHALFTAAALRALSRCSFLPAEVGGTKVRMLAEQQFKFAIDGGRESTQRP